jgi:hypothetical protein
MNKQKNLSQIDLSKFKDEDLSVAQRAELKRRFDTFIETMRGRGKAGKAAAQAKNVREWTPAKAGNGQAPGQAPKRLNGASARVTKRRPTSKTR